MAQPEYSHFWSPFAAPILSRHQAFHRATRLFYTSAVRFSAAFSSTSKLCHYGSQAGSHFRGRIDPSASSNFLCCRGEKAAPMLIAALTQ